MTTSANEDLVVQLDRIIETITERIVEHLRSAAEEDDGNRVEQLELEKRLSRARRSLEKARRLLVSDHELSDDTLP